VELVQLHHQILSQKSVDSGLSCSFAIIIRRRDDCWKNWAVLMHWQWLERSAPCRPSTIFPNPLDFTLGAPVIFANQLCKYMNWCKFFVCKPCRGSPTRQPGVKFHTLLLQGS
jgi:hypothetical protein